MTTRQGRRTPPSGDSVWRSWRSARAYRRDISKSARHASPRTGVPWGRVAVLVAALLVACAGIGLASSLSGAKTRSGVRVPAGQRHPTSHSARTTTTVPPSTTTTIDPGTLPQTDQLPETDTPQFGAESTALWNGIVTDSAAAAMPAFFPESAYVQVKQIADPQSDYTDRLVAEYALDIGAAHALLGPDSTGARLTDIEVDESYAHWVPPGTCSNGIGYYEVPNSRVVFEVNGQTRSFGIASMISWRGVWYVVHLGAVSRDSEQGVVDDPESGPGTPAPSSTC